MSALLTHHAKARGRERLSLKPSSVQRMAEIALEKGICREDTAGSLRRYLDGRMSEHPKGHFRIYGEVLFIFVGKTMITCWQVPAEFRRTVKKIRGAKRS